MKFQSLLGAVLLLGLFAGPSHAQGAQDACRLDRYSEIPITTMPDGRFTVPIVLNGRTLDFLVDTGGVTVGIDYNTTEYGSFILEYSVTGPLQKDPELLRDNPLQSYAFGYSKNFLRDTLTFNSFVVTFLKYSNILFRFNLTYKITDVISTYVQYTGIFIASGDPDLRIFDKYDRMDFQLSYAFDLAK